MALSESWFFGRIDIAFWLSLTQTITFGVGGEMGRPMNCAVVLFCRCGHLFGLRLSSHETKAVSHG